MIHPAIWCSRATPVKIKPRRAVGKARATSNTRSRSWTIATEADKRLIFASYTQTSAGQIVADIISQVLASEGVTYSAATVASGPTITQVTWNGKQVSAALTWLAQTSGYWWNIDNNGVLWFQPYGGVPAPFVLDGTQVNVDSNLSVTFGNDMYVNRQYVKGAYAQTGVLTESQHGDGSKVAFTLSYEIASTAAADISIKVNGVRSDHWHQGQHGLPVLCGCG